MFAIVLYRRKIFRLVEQSDTSILKRALFMCAHFACQLSDKLAPPKMLGATFWVIIANCRYSCRLISFALFGLCAPFLGEKRRDKFFFMTGTLPLATLLLTLKCFRRKTIEIFFALSSSWSFEQTIRAPMTVCPPVCLCVLRRDHGGHSIGSAALRTISISNYRTCLIDSVYH